MNPIELLEYLRKNCDVNLMELKHALRTVKLEKQTLSESREHLQSAYDTQKILQQLAERIQQNVHKQISSVVTRCLKAVFGDDGYEFNIDFVQARGKTEARLQFIRDGNVLEDPKCEAGMGAVEVAGFALRLVCLALMRPKRRRILCLDEPCKSLHSKLYRERFRDLLLTLSKETDVQIVMSTGIESYMIGNIIDLEELES